MLYIKQEKSILFFSSYFELFYTIVIFPRKLQKITLLRNVMLTVPKGAFGLPVILWIKKQFIWSLSDTSAVRWNLEQTGECSQPNTPICPARERNAKWSSSRGLAVPFHARRFATRACAPTRGYRDEDLGREMESERPLAFIDHKSLRSLRIQVKTDMRRY